MDKKNPVLTIVCGLPRSGKSTWIEKNKKESDVIVSPDDFRYEIFAHQFSLPAEPFIWALTETFILLLMRQQKDIILDATSVSSYARKKYMPLVEKYGYKTRLVWIDTSLKECLKRNKKSGKKRIPEDIIYKLYDKFNRDPLYEDYSVFDRVLKVRKGKAFELR